MTRARKKCKIFAAHAWLGMWIWYMSELHVGKTKIRLPILRLVWERKNGKENSAIWDFMAVPLMIGQSVLTVQVPVSQQQYLIYSFIFFDFYSDHFLVKSWFLTRIWKRINLKTHIKHIFGRSWTLICPLFSQIESFLFFASTFLEL